MIVRHPRHVQNVGEKTIISVLAAWRVPSGYWLTRHRTARAVPLLIFKQLLRDKSDDLGRYTDAYLDQTPQFIRVLSRFYHAMALGGPMFLTIYQDVPEAETAQVDFYENTGQHVVTPAGSRFVANAEGFWSARWTEDSMLSYFSACGIRAEDVVFNELNAIAWLVEIKK